MVNFITRTEPTHDSMFPLFTSLPPELRNQIWRDALPEPAGSSLHFYQKGCWQPRRLTETDEGYYDEDPESNLSLEWRSDYLNDIQFKLPLLFVNQEARSIAQAWVREQGSLEKSMREDGRYPVFIRPFNIEQDALYVPLGEWNDFIAEPVDRMFQPDMEDELLSMRTDLRHLAVPEELLRSEDGIAALPELLTNYYNVELLLLVIGEQPRLRSVSNDAVETIGWKFESTCRGSFFWNEQSGDFQFSAGKRATEGDLYRLIEEVIENGLRKEIIHQGIHKFEIRPVFSSQI